MISIGVAKVYSAQLRELMGDFRNQSVDILEIGFESFVPDELPQSFVERARTIGLGLSCHLPFAVNLGTETDKGKSVAYLAKGLKIANALGGVAVFHPGFYGDRNFEGLRTNLLQTIRQALATVPKGGGKLGIETTGKVTQIGTVEEILSLVKEINDKAVVPVIDWAHMYARSQGKFPRTVVDFRLIIDRMMNELNPERLFFHMSGIEYGKGGERKHLSIKTCSPPLPYLLHVVKQIRADCQIVLESPDSIGDVAWVRNILDDPEKWYPFAEERLRKSQMNFMDAYL